MRAAIIVDGIVDNIIEIDALDAVPGLELVDATGAQIGDAWDGEQFITPAAPDTPPEVPDYVAAVQRMLDAKAQERRYDDILSACTYATSTQPTFQAEGQACVAWRDKVWARCYELMAQVENGDMPQPSVVELLSMLPSMEWPE